MIGWRVAEACSWLASHSLLGVDRQLIMTPRCPDVCLYGASPILVISSLLFFCAALSILSITQGGVMFSDDVMQQVLLPKTISLSPLMNHVL